MPRMFDSVLYHGTKPEKIEDIMREGLKPTYLGNSIICMSPKPEIAKNFGGMVLEVNVEGYDISCFEDCEAWERFVWTKGKAIPPNRIKLMSPEHRKVE